MKIKLYYNNKKEPIQIMETGGGQMMKHQIASMILLTADTIEDISKIRVVIDKETENGNDGAN